MTQKQWKPLDVLFFFFLRRRMARRGLVLFIFVILRARLDGTILKECSRNLEYWFLLLISYLHYFTVWFSKIFHCRFWENRLNKKYRSPGILNVNLGCEIYETTLFSNSGWIKVFIYQAAIIESCMKILIILSMLIMVLSEFQQHSHSV